MNRTVPRATSTFLGAIGEAMRFEYARIWKDSAGREVRGLLDVGTLKPVFQPVRNFISAWFVYNQKAGEFGWPTRTTAKPVPRGDHQIIYMDFG